MLRTIAALLVLALCAGTTAEANGGRRERNHARALGGDWVLIATRSVDLRKERERFEVGAGKGRFESLAIVGVDRPIDISRVTIATDGETYIHSERQKLSHGQRSQPVRFSHERRIVQHVDISYRLDLGAAGPAKVELWGLREAPDAPVTRSDAGWVWIATRSVDLHKEEDRIKVGAGKGRFKSLRLVGLDRLINIDRVTIATDGKEHVEKRRMRLDRGGRSQPMNFSRDGRIVEHVDLSYRLHLGAAGPANVELWGLRASLDEPVARVQDPPQEQRAREVSRSSGPGSAAAASQPEGETDGAGAVLFGIQDVGPDVDHDVFKLGREYGRFGRIRLRALGKGVQIKEMRVVYTGGEPDVLAVGTEVAANELTRWFELKGERFIREIHFVYASQSRSKARLEVYGEYADSWFRAGAGTGAFSSANQGWLYLGGQSPLFVSIRKGLGYETDVVSVARNRGFRNLRLDVKNRAITLNQIKVIYSDDTNDVFGNRQRVDGGSSFGPVELTSRRPVKRIEISYRSRIFDSQAQGSGYAFVEFWAK